MQTPHHYTFLYTNFFPFLAAAAKRRQNVDFGSFWSFLSGQNLAASAKGGGGLLTGDSHWTRERERQRHAKKGMDFFLGGREIKGSCLAGMHPMCSWGAKKKRDIFGLFL